MYEFRRLREVSHMEELSLYQSFTTKPYDAMLADLAQQNHFIAIGLLYESQPVGMVLAVKSFPTQIHVVSMYVQREHRHQGLGTRLMSKLEEEILKDEKHVRVFYTRYPTSMDSAPFFERILLKLKWVVQDALLMITISKENVPWLNTPFKKPANFEYFMWKDLKPEERESIVIKEKTENWFKENPGFSPFIKESDIEYSNSLGVRYEGQVIGWMITHRIFPDTIQYWCLFVDPRFQSTGIGLHLAIEAARLHPANCKAFFMIRQRMLDANHQWKSFLDKRVIPYCSSFTRVNEAFKFMKGTIPDSMNGS